MQAVGLPRIPDTRATRAYTKILNPFKLIIRSFTSHIQYIHITLQNEVNPYHTRTYVHL